MKIFVSVFLLILSSVSFVKVVLGIKCHQTENPEEPHCWEEFYLSGRARPKELSRLVACFRNAVREEKDPNCEEGINASCYTITFEFADQTQHMIKHCDDSEHSHCPHAKETFEGQFPFGRFIKSSRCDSCSSDNCNDQKPRDKPSVPESPAPPRMAADLKCHLNDLDVCGSEVENQNKLIDCVRNATKVDKIRQCPYAMAACTKIRIKFEDGEQLVLKECIGPETPDCEEQTILYGKFFPLTKVECESCATNFCNGGSPTEATPSEPSHNQETNSGEKHNRETHSGRSNSMATSTAPIAFGILIFYLLVHFLL